MATKLKKAAIAIRQNKGRDLSQKNSPKTACASLSDSIRHVTAIIAEFVDAIHENERVIHNHTRDGENAAQAH